MRKRGTSRLSDGVDPRPSVRTRKSDPPGSYIRGPKGRTPGRGEWALSADVLRPLVARRPVGVKCDRRADRLPALPVRCGGPLPGRVGRELPVRVRTCRKLFIALVARGYIQMVKNAIEWNWERAQASLRVELEAAHYEFPGRSLIMKTRQFGFSNRGCWSWRALAWRNLADAGRECPTGPCRLQHLRTLAGHADGAGRGQQSEQRADCATSGWVSRVGLLPGRAARGK